jgi:hypothetical protein
MESGQLSARPAPGAHLHDLDIESAGTGKRPRPLFLVSDIAVDAAVASGGVVSDQVNSDPRPRLLMLARQRAATFNARLDRLLVGTIAPHSLSSRRSVRGRRPRHPRTHDRAVPLTGKDVTLGARMQTRCKHMPRNPANCSSLPAEEELLQRSSRPRGSASPPRAKPALRSTKQPVSGGGRLREQVLGSGQSQVSRSGKRSPGGVSTSGCGPERVSRSAGRLRGARYVRHGPPG